jgi:hypothetical protein
LICVLIGSFSIVVGFFIKLIPLSLFERFKYEEEPLKTDLEKERAFRSAFRKSRSIYRSKTKKNLSGKVG